MIHIVSKKIKGRKYLYLVKSVREKDKVKQVTIKYIGPERFVSKEEFYCMKQSYTKKDWILNICQDQLSYQDHEAMKNASDLYAKYLNSLDKVSKEKQKEKFLSKFITNSNAIEGSTLTEKDTFTYLFQDLTPKGKTKKELYMATNLYKAWGYVENNCNRMFTEKDVKQLHLLVNKDIEEERTLGEYKQVQNYIGDVLTTSFLFVKERMNSFFKWIKQAKINEFEVAFQSHAQFEIIHPFVDGNGRVGRLLINWLLMYWGYQPLAIRNDKRLEYLSALQNSQRGKIEAICKFCYSEYMYQYKSVV